MIGWVLFLIREFGMWILELFLIMALGGVWFLAGLVWMMFDAMRYKDTYGWTYAIVTWPARTVTSWLIKSDKR